MHRRITQSFLILLTLSTSSLAQTFNVLAGAPACAQACTALQQAQTSCNSLFASGPFASVASCFCTTPTIATTGSNPAGVCPNCADDIASVQSWFGQYCAAPATVTAVQAPAAATTAAGGGNAATTATTTPATGTQPVASATNSLGIVMPVEPQSYWSAHGRWIIMVIVLLVGFGIIITVGVIWKKRYNKKRNAASQLPPGSLWGPSHRSHPSLVHPSDSNVAIGQQGGNDAEKATPYVSDLQRSETDSNILERPQEGKGRRLKKLVGR